MKLYDQFYAWLQKRWTAEEVYPPTDVFKRKYISSLSGTILEIGPGGGSNFKYLSKNIFWIGLEPNAPINEALREEARRRGFADIELYNSIAENIPLSDSSCDAVLATFVLCSVKNQQQVLQEIVRVLKPGGKFVFIDHVAASSGTFLRFYQNLINPFSRLWAKNCHSNRETLKAIKAAGFILDEVEIENIKMKFVSIPHIRGTAHKKLINKKETNLK